MLLAAVFLFSLSSLAFEILLARAFSIGQWNHLSFMVISIALFGFGASGTGLSLLGARYAGWENRLAAPWHMKWVAPLYAFLLLSALWALNLIPLDYFRLPLESMQIGYLLFVYLLLAAPFFITGAVTSLAYAHMPARTGSIYAASMAGSASGAALAWILVPALGEAQSIVLMAILPMLLALGGNRGMTRQRFPWLIASGFATIVIACTGIYYLANVGIGSQGSERLQIRPSAYKALSHTLRFPDTFIVDTRSTLRGRIDRVESPHFHFAPGLSLGYDGPLTAQSVLFRDGDDSRVLYHLDAEAQEPEGPHRELDFARFTLSYAGYHLVSQSPEALLIRGGGLSIPCAMAAGAESITIVEENPDIARAIAAHYDATVVAQDPRRFLATSEGRYDLIHLESWGSSLPGASALDQDHLLTTGAFSEYLKHLSKGGIFTVSRRLHLPPSDMVRLWATAFESLRNAGFADPAHHILLLRNWDTYVLILSMQPRPRIAPLERFSHQMKFDWIYAAGIGPDNANRYNLFDDAIYYTEIDRIAEAYRERRERGYHQASLLDTDPRSDLRPFPNHFIKWSRLQDLYRTTGSRFYAVFMSGEIVVVAVFLQALVLSTILLAAPYAFRSSRRERPPTSRVFYFLVVGAGFMCVEIYFIKAFVLVFGDPVVSLTVVLTGLLVFSGVGGFCSKWVSRRYQSHVLLALVALLGLLGCVGDSLVDWILAMGETEAYAVSFLLLMVPGILMGLPFTLGMTHLLETPVQRAYAWAANGCASVLASIASAQVALSAGIPAVLICGIGAYILAFLTLRTGAWRRNPK